MAFKKKEVSKKVHTPTSGGAPSGEKQTKTVQQELPRRNYVGGGWDNSGKYGVFLTLQLNKEKIGELQEDKYGNIRVTVAKRKEKDERSGMELMVYEADYPSKS